MGGYNDGFQGNRGDNVSLACSCANEIFDQSTIYLQPRNRSTIYTKTRDIFLGLTFVSKGDDQTIDSAVVEDEEGVQSET